MRMAAMIGASILGLLLGTTVPARADHGRGDEQKGGRQHENEHQKGPGRSQAQHSERRQEGGPQRGHQGEIREQQIHRPEAHRSESRREPYGRPGYRPVHDVWQPHRAEHWEREHHSWRERGGYHGERIREEDFREHFGRGRWFRVHSVPVIVVDSRPRFQFGGYWFTLVDPWPEYWSATWYRTDDVCIDYVNDGYYLYNRRHPGVAIAVNVSF
jgi:hypothetical protein